MTTAASAQIVLQEPASLPALRTAVQPRRHASSGRHQASGR